MTQSDAPNEFMSEWIKCSERLPDKDTVVFCIGDGQRPSMAWYNGKDFERYCDEVPGDRFLLIHYTKITHWMLLPKPPKI